MENLKIHFKTTFKLVTISAPSTYVDKPVINLL